MAPQALSALVVIVEGTYTRAGFIAVAPSNLVILAGGTDTVRVLTTPS